MTDEQESGVSADASADSEDAVIVLDYLARGDSDADTQQYRRSPVAYAVRPSDFALFALALTDDAHVSIGDRLVVQGPGTEDLIADTQRVAHADLSAGAQSELEYVVEEIIEAETERFVDFYNEAQPISLRLHQLNLLPGIGKKLRNNILDERKRRPFESFENVEERVSGLHDPKGVLVDRVLEELRQTDLKYRNFVDVASEEGS
jgi:putative nucleotide binding protein